MDMESETQWKVTWFPPDKDEVTRTGTEQQVRKIADLKRDWLPIIESREVIVQPWTIVKNYADPEEPSEADG